MQHLMRQLSIAIILALLVNVSAAHSEDYKVTFQTNPNVPIAVQDLVTELASPEKFIVSGRVIIKDVVLAKCGTVNQRYLSKLTNINHLQLDSGSDGVLSLEVAQGTELLLPACLKLPSRRAVTVNVGASDYGLESLLKREFPEWGPITTDTIAELNRLPRNDENAPIILRGQKIQLPYGTSTTTIYFKNAEDLAAFNARLPPIIADPTIQTASKGKITPSGELSLVAGELPQIQQSTCLNARDKVRELGHDVWPYSASELSATISFLSGYAGKSGLDLAADDRVKIGILDTGVALAENNSLFQHFVNTKVAYATSGGQLELAQIEPYPQRPNSTHGTQVAYLSIGGPLLADSAMNTFLASHLELFPYNLERAPTEDADSQIVAPPVDQMRDGFKYLNTATDGVYIANVSYYTTFNLRSDQLIARILSSGVPAFELIVAAAGNRPEILEKDQSFPAALSDAVDVPVLSVGASDGADGPAEFSSFSSERVDLFAPGCDIPLPGLNTGAFFGTSASAPQVTLAAALLRSMGLKDARSIKRVLLLTTDYSEKLKGRARSAGILNTQKALLNLFFDLIEYREGQERKLVWGVLENRRTNTVAMTCGGKKVDWPLEKIGRIFAPNEADNRSLHITRLSKVDIVSSGGTTDDKIPLPDFSDDPTADCSLNDDYVALDKIQSFGDLRILESGGTTEMAKIKKGDIISVVPSFDLGGTLCRLPFANNCDK